MKDYKTENIRNICLGAHSGAGKTSLAEALLFNLGVASRIGTIENGNTISDYNDDEIERQISISSALLHGEWDNNKINFIDTPGYSDFFGEVVGALNATDAVMVVISAAGGVEVGTEMVWNKAKNLNLPRMIVINKLDRENLNFDNVINSLQEAFGRKVVLTQFPVNAGPGFNAIRDDHVLLSEEFFDEDLKPVKLMTVGEIQMISGRMFPKIWKMRESGVKDKYTLLHYKQLRFLDDLPDRLFTLQELRTPRRR